jgi:hypothetical protein
MGKAWGWKRLSQVTTRSLVSMMAVNMELEMPMESVTANPRTGPEPKE